MKLKKLKIIHLAQEPYVEGYEGAFYRFNGGSSACGIWDNWYIAYGNDDEGTKYRIVWSITNTEAFNNGDEDCCNWDNPDEIYDMDNNVVIENAIIEW